MVNSKQKGKCGERELAQWIRENWGFSARRGQQFKGTPDSPDIDGVPGVNIECKRTEKLSLYKALEQAKKDSGGKIPIVLHRQSRKPWVIIIEADRFYELAALLGPLIKENTEVNSLEPNVSSA